MLRVSKVRKRLVSLGQHNALEIFTAKRNIVSRIRKVLVNDIFAEFDGSSGIKNIITDRLNLSEFQVDNTLAKSTGESTRKYITSQVNQALSRCFFSVFSENWGRWISTIFQLS